MSYRSIGQFGRPGAVITGPNGAWLRQPDGGYLFERQGVIGRDAEIRSSNFEEDTPQGWRLKGNGTASFGLGVVGRATDTNDSGVVSAVNMANVTVTTQVGRLYRVSVSVPYIQKDTTAGIVITQISDSGGVTVKFVGRNSHGSAEWYSVSGWTVVEGDDASHGYRATVTTGAGQFRVRGDLAAVETFIEDIGPA